MHCHRIVSTDPKIVDQPRASPISCGIQYRILGSDREKIGSGKTINMSSSGLLLVTDRILSPGRRVEVMVDWPVKRAGLKLVIFGEVVRVVTEGATQAAVRIERHEFRTFSRS
jgi:hypothetical protein